MRTDRRRYISLLLCSVDGPMHLGSLAAAAAKVKEQEREWEVKDRSRTSMLLVSHYHFVSDFILWPFVSSLLKWCDWDRPSFCTWLPYCCFHRPVAIKEHIDRNCMLRDRNANSFSVRALVKKQMMKDASRLNRNFEVRIRHQTSARSKRVRLRRGDSSVWWDRRLCSLSVTQFSHQQLLAFIWIFRLHHHILTVSVNRQYRWLIGTGFPDAQSSAWNVTVFWNILKTKRCFQVNVEVQSLCRHGIDKYFKR